MSLRRRLKPILKRFHATLDFSWLLGSMMLGPAASDSSHVVDAPREHHVTIRKMHIPEDLHDSKTGQRCIILRLSGCGLRPIHVRAAVAAVVAVSRGVRSESWLESLLLPAAHRHAPAKSRGVREAPPDFPVAEALAPLDALYLCECYVDASRTVSKQRLAELRACTRAVEPPPHAPHPTATCTAVSASADEPSAVAVASAVAAHRRHVQAHIMHVERREGVVEAWARSVT